MTIRIKQVGASFVYEAGPLVGSPIAVGGTSGAVQFNDNSTFGGDSNFIFDKNSNTLTVSNITGSLTRLSSGFSYLNAGSNITITTASVGASIGQITISSTASGGTPAGSDKQIQFNNAGSFGSSTNFNFDTVSNQLLLTGSFDIKNSSNVSKFTVNPNTGLDGHTNVEGTLTCWGLLTVNDIVDVAGNFNVNTDKFTIVAATGAVSGSSTAIFGNTLLNGSLTVTTTGGTGDGVFAGNVAINGGDITTTSSTATIFAATAVALTIGSSATSISIGGGSGTTSINNNLVAPGTSNTVNNLSVTGSAGLSVTNGALIGGNLTAIGGVFINNDLGVSGSTAFGNATSDTVTFIAQVNSDVLPSIDSTYNLGSLTNRWANVYTADLHLKNDRGDYTIIEEKDFLSIRFNRSGKRYKFLLEAVPELDEDPVLKF